MKNIYTFFNHMCIRLLLLILSICTIQSVSAQDSRENYFLEYAYESYIPVIKKEGKEAKREKVLRKFYSISFKIKNRYVVFTKYVEEFKKEKIREIIYELKPTLQSKFYWNDIIRTENIKSFKSLTHSTSDFCCFFDKTEIKRYFSKNNETYPTLVFKVRGTIKYKHLFKNKQSNIYSFYENIENFNLRSNLKPKGFTDKGIIELNDIIKHIKDKYGEYSEIEKKYKPLVNNLKNRNKYLRENLKNVVPNITTNRGLNPNIKVYNSDSDIKFIHIFEFYKWYYILDLEIGQWERDNHFIVVYPKGHPYEGEVYLKRINQSDGGRLFLGEVYKTTTKKKIPYNKLIIESNGSSVYYRPIKIWGLDGTFNKSNWWWEYPGYRLQSYFKNQLNDKNYQLQIGNKNDYLEVKKFKEKFISDYYKYKYSNDFFDWLIKEWPQEIDNKIASIKNRDLNQTKKRINEYINEKNNSITKYGFFLEYIDLNKQKQILSSGLQRKDVVSYDLVSLYKGKKRFYGKNLLEEAALIYTFMRKKAKVCGYNGIESDKAMIYDEVCVERLERVRDGANMGCSKWKEAPSGLYTRKEMYDTYLKIKKKSTSLNGIGEQLIIAGSQEKTNSMLKKVDIIKKDIEMVFKLNKCGKALDRLEENIIRTMNSKDLIKLDK